MLFDSEMRLLVFDRPVAFQVARELQRFAIFILLTFFGITMRTFLFQLITAQRPAGRFHQASINRNAFVDGKPFGFELAQDLRILPRYKFRLFLGIVE